MNRGQIRDARTYVADRLREYQIATPGADGAADEQARAEQYLDEWLGMEAHRRMAANQQALTHFDEQELRRAVLNRLFGLGELQPLLDDPDIETIFINAHDKVFVKLCDGSKRELETPVADSQDELMEQIRRLAAREGLGERRWDPLAPFLDLTLRDGSRVNAVRDVVRHATITIRLHRLMTVSLDDLVRMGTLHTGDAALLEAVILSNQSVLVAGVTGSGKSTFARGLASCIPPQKRIVSIEDTFELHLDRDDAHPDCVAMQTRRPNVQGHGAITAEDLFRNALRMNPDVLIVGEVRGPAEALPMLMATAAGGAAGSISTIHAQSAEQAIPQLQTYILMGAERLPFEASAQIIAKALDFVVFIEQRGARRLVSSIAEIRGVMGDHVTLNVISAVGADGRHQMSAAFSQARKDRLEAVGYHTQEWATGTDGAYS
ncbi:MAG: type II secretion system protein E [Candidatus Aeolococcus gillhamiae]|uniref:Type II secretion system protein E n=1 Tax=Candidatus Aeolococcus gillhamiae TaxID=3127015 RepID=A0A2W6A492_9BACT|nr:MAG: type II secretion system protein E [Candidatus Dormibacter sp. RRmetagenome_bin12]